MKRSSFLKSLVGLSAAAVIAPNILIQEAAAKPKVIKGRQDIQYIRLGDLILAKGSDDKVYKMCVTHIFTKNGEVFEFWARMLRPVSGVEESYKNPVFIGVFANAATEK